MDSELPLGTSCSLGCWEGRQGRKGPESWTSGEGSATRQSPPGWGTELLMLCSGKQGLTVPAEPSPAESRLGTATEGLQAQNACSASPVQVAAASWGPAGPRIVARALESRGGREERKSVSLGSEDGFFFFFFGSHS